MIEFAKDLLGIFSQKNISFSEAHKYLQLYSSNDKPYAVIKIGGECIHDDNEFKLLMQGLYLLGRLGIFPIVVYGWGNYLDLKMKEKSLEIKKIEGKRVTTKEVLELIVDIIAYTQKKIKLGICKVVEEVTPGKIIVPEIFDISFMKTFEANQISNKDLGYVGNIINVDTKNIFDNFKHNMITMTAPLGYGINKDSLFNPFGIDDLYNINGDTAAIELTKAIKPYKYIFLTKIGGILDYEGNIIKRINILSDYDINSGVIYKDGIEISKVTGGMKVKIDEIVSLLTELGCSASAQIASPNNLLVELLTDRGAGTFIKLGYNIICSNYNDKILNRIIDIINLSFCLLGRVLNDDYIPKDNSVIYYDDNYQGVAIVNNIACYNKNMSYLDKFAVIPDSQRNGLGTALLEKVYNDNKFLFWRSLTNNIFNDMYYKFVISHGGGVCNFGKWNIYWTNNIDISLIKEICNKPEDFKNLIK